MTELFDPDWYVEHALVHAEPLGFAAPSRGPVATWREWWQQRAQTSDEPLRSAAASGFVLTTGELTALGVTRSRTRAHLRGERWTLAGRGAVAPLDVRDDPDPDGEGVHRARARRAALYAAAAVRRRPGTAAGGRSAAVLHGLPVVRVPDPPELLRAENWEGRLSAAHLYSAALPPEEVGSWYGIAVESPARTLVTLARHGRRDAIMAADAALREHLVEERGIQRALQTAVGWPWVRQAREVLALADPLAESPLESITRLALHDSGFPRPRLQVWFGDDRVDFWWPEYGLVLEADGRFKYVGDASLREKQRERRLLRHPDVRCIERVMWTDVTRDWDRTSSVLRRYFR